MEAFESQKLTMYDVIIIGAGAAGLSAALWCDELGLKTLVLESDAEIGGQLLWVYNPVENHLGAMAANGCELRDKFAAQTKLRNFELLTNASIAQVDLKNKQIVLENGDILAARALIAATGIRRRRLNIPGEDEFRGRGILESGKRDAALISGKNVAVIGGGDAACENALILAETANRVFLIHRGEMFRAREEFTEKIKQNPRIEIHLSTQVLRISGEERIAEIELKKTSSNKIFTLPVEAVLFRIGVEPNTELFKKQLELEANGYIKINHLCQTSAENVFAVGDVANPVAPTVSSAVGMGATAAKAVRHLLD